MTRLRALEGTYDYNKQRVGLVLKNGILLGLCYVSILDVLLFGTIINLSEICLFDSKEFQSVLPFVIKRIHFDIVPERRPFCIRIENLEESVFKTEINNTAESFGAIKSKCRLLTIAKFEDKEKL